MLTKLKQLTFFYFLIAIGLPTIGHTQQEGVYDLRIVAHSIDCYNDILYCDIQVRAEEPGQEFYMGSQDYYMGLSQGIENPFLMDELEISGVILGNGPEGYSAYETHSLTGSLDTVLAYHVNLAGGDGIYIGAEDYVPVGRVGLYITDFDEPVGIKWSQQLVFPGTYIYDNEHEHIGQGSYLDYYQDIKGACDNLPPVVVIDNPIVPEGESTVICPSANDSDPENLLDHTSVELLNLPPASEGTVTLDTLTGCITFTPHPDFSGVVTPIDYQICDEGVYIQAYGGNNNPNPRPLPDPGDPDIQLQTPICDTNTINITVDNELVNIAIVNNGIIFSSVNVFPSPADKELNINYTLLERANVNITLWNTLGQPAIEPQISTQQTANNYNERINISHLSAGHYMLSLQINDSVITRLIYVE